MSVLIENVTSAELLQWMQEEAPFSEEEYLKWRERQLLRRLERPKRRRDCVYGRDFKAYWNCPRILFWETHDPAPKGHMINKGIFKAEKKHVMIQDRLKERGWKPEFEPRRLLEKYNIQGIGHVDALSPSISFLLETKHNPPTLADELQAAWYQYLIFGHPCIVLQYRERVEIIPDHGRLIGKYIPRVVGTITHDELPPKHPSFPRCRGTCDYGPRCGRQKTYPMAESVPQAWIDWLRKIEAIV